MAKRRIRRTYCSRGRLLNMHDCLREGVVRRVDMRAYISGQAEGFYQDESARLGITKSGLAGLVLEAVAVRGLLGEVLGPTILDAANHGATDAVNH
jgi:hypothetical protein